MRESCSPIPKNPLKTPPDMTAPRPHWSQQLPAWRARLRALPRLLILSDFDGTLSPIVDHPELAVLHPEAPAVLEDLLRLHPRVRMALVSGRSLADLRGRLAIRQDSLILAGNHGLEMAGAGLDWVHPDALALRGRLDTLAAALKDIAPRFDGAEVEDKGLSLTLHDRRVAAQQLQALHQAVDRVEIPAGIRRATGKRIIEFRPDLAWHKGSILRRLQDRLGIPAAATLYLGDDVTDEDAFQKLPEPGLTVHVGAAETPSAARFQARDPADAVQLLAAILKILREP